MASLNLVQIIGRVGKDIELKHSNNGTAFGTMNVATDESYTTQQGEKVQQTEWHTVAINGKQAENCAKYLGKGSMVYVEGSIRTRKWTDKNGNDRYATEVKAHRVQFLDGQKNGQGNGQGKQQNNEDDYGNVPF